LCGNAESLAVIENESINKLYHKLQATVDALFTSLVLLCLNLIRAAVVDMYSKSLEQIINLDLKIN
jgi:hypothetical protein